MKNFIIYTVLILSSISLQAQVALTNMSESDLESLVNEMGANFHQFSLVKADNENQRYEFGIMSGSTNSTTLRKLSTGISLKSIPHASIFGGGYFSNGLTAEVSYLPSVKAQDVKLTSGSIGLKWAAKTVFQDLPVHLSLKGFVGTSTVNWQQVIATVLTDMKYNQNFYGLNIQVSKEFSIFEPYAVVGLSKNSGEVNASGSTSIFSSSFTTNTSAESKVSGQNYSLGCNVNQQMLSVGLEIGNYYGSQVTTAKMSALF